MWLVGCIVVGILLLGAGAIRGSSLASRHEERLRRDAGTGESPTEYRTGRP